MSNRPLLRYLIFQTVITRLHELAERELNELERMVTLSLRLENARERDETSNAKKKTKESSDSKTSSQKNKGKPVKDNSSGKPSAKETPKPSAKETPKPSAKETPKPASKKEVQSSPQPGMLFITKYYYEYLRILQAQRVVLRSLVLRN